MSNHGQTMARTQVMSASSLSGHAVVNAQDEDLGNIKEIMLDVNRGTISYAVLSFGGFMGLGDKLFAIPWNAMTIDADRERLMLDFPKETFEQAPGFDKDNWPDSSDDTWLGEVYDHYGAERYW